MKQYLVACLLVLGFGGSSLAQAPQSVPGLLSNNIANTLNGLVGDIQDSTGLVPQGNAHGGSNGLINTLTGLLQGVRAGTLAQPLADAGAGDTVVDAGGLLYGVLQGVSGSLAGLGAPATEPPVATIHGVTYQLSLDHDTVVLPGIDGVPIPATGGSDMPSLPGLPDLGGVLRSLPLPGLPK